MFHLRAGGASPLFAHSFGKEAVLPNRIIRDGINSSSRINKLSPGAEILYRRLMSVADDYGRFYAAPATVRGSCWPTCPEKVSEKEVGRWLEECAAGEKPLIYFYDVNSCKYLEIIAFGQQTRTKSKFPDRPDIRLISECNQNDGTSRSRISESETKAGNTSPNSSEVWPSVELLVKLYNEKAADEMGFVHKVSPARRKKAMQYLAMFPGLDFWEEAFANTHQSKFLRGLAKNGFGHENFKADFDWLLSKGKDGTENVVKVFEGKYSD